MLQCAAVCCSVLQYVAVCCSMLQCVATEWCCVAVCRSVLQCVTNTRARYGANKVASNSSAAPLQKSVPVLKCASCGVLQSFSVMQCVAVCCSVFSSVAVYCSVLQCVAVGCREMRLIR